MRYQLDVSAEQLEVLCDAAHLLARCSMGQFEDILWLCHVAAARNDRDGIARDCFLRASRTLFQDGCGIANADAQGKRAWDLYQVVRKRLADDSGSLPEYHVNNREPSAICDEPLATVTPIADEEAA